MKVILLCALLAAAAIAWAASPLIRAGGKDKRAGFTFITLAALGALALYLWLGSPDMPGQPALFQTQGPRASQRALVREELDLMQAIADNPGDTALKTALGTVRLQKGNAIDAVAILAIALGESPDDAGIREKLGAAHYLAGIQAVNETGQTLAALEHFEQALAIAPKNAPYRAELEADLLKLKQMSDE